MTEREFEILEKLNELIESENGEPITLGSMLSDANLDSFGLTVLFIDLNEEYNCYSKEEIHALKIPNLSIRNIVDRIQNVGK